MTVIALVRRLCRFVSTRLNVMHPVEPVTLVWKDLEVDVIVPITRA